MADEPNAAGAPWSVSGSATSTFRGAFGRQHQVNTNFNLNIPGLESVGEGLASVNAQLSSLKANLSSLSSGNSAGLNSMLGPAVVVRLTSN